MDLRVLFIGFVLLGLVSTAEHPESHILRRLRRSVETATTKTAETTTSMSLCSTMAPCKWGPYDDSVNKKEMYFIESNICVCGSNRTCELSEESLSMKAYIYRCKPVKLPDF